MIKSARREKIFEFGSGTGLGNRFKCQVIERRPGAACGHVVHETAWASNLILDQGMNNLVTMGLTSLFNYAVIGTGTTPTQDDSGSILATASGTAVTAASAFFAAGDVGKLIRFDTGQKAYITAFTDNQHVTIGATLTVASGTHFVLYRVAQVGLTTEIHRTNNYLPGSPNCGTTWASNIATHQRTYDFPIEGSDQAYNEIGFSNSASVAANLNMRAILAGAPVTVLTGQQLRVVYQVLATFGPTTPQSLTASISGWPSLQHAVAADSGTDLITLVAHGFAANTQVFLNGTTPPGGLTFGTVYYVVSNTADTFFLAATSGGGAIDITSSGSGVILFTNTNGTQQLVGMSCSIVNSSDGSNGTQNEASLHCEPWGAASGAAGVLLSTDTAALPTWTISQTFVNGFAGGNMSPDTYTNGSFTRTARLTFATGSGNSSAIRKIGFGDYDSFFQRIYDGPVFFFDQNQEKTNLYTLQIVCRWTWDRIFS